MMRFKELTVMGILAIFFAVIIISSQENDDSIITLETLENFENVQSIEKIGLKVVQYCYKTSSNLIENKICFNEKINQLESKFPTIQSELRKLGFGIKNDSST
ncbi:MAG: hypothetical protein IIA81_08060 [Thaumarchaeota archaeon]|nr:hypothetical protein [Nitrososphaerota archaeon]